MYVSAEQAWGQTGSSCPLFMFLYQPQINKLLSLTSISSWTFCNHPALPFHAVTSLFYPLIYRLHSQTVIRHLLFNTSTFLCHTTFYFVLFLSPTALLNLCFVLGGKLSTVPREVANLKPLALCRRDLMSILPVFMFPPPSFALACICQLA